MRDPTLPAEPLSRATRPPAGGLRDLSLGDLIGRRGPLRTSIAAVRGNRRDRNRIGAWSGVALTGVGGIGKTALAGRVLTRMRADGWLIAKHIGVWNPPALITAVTTALDGGAHSQLAEELRQPGSDDAQKLGVILQLLHRERVLLLFDDFEQNLTPDARGFLDPGFAEIFHALIETAEVGRVLVTCRYPVPDAELLLRVELPPLTPSELRRLFLRLPKLRDLPEPDRHLVTRTIGGHPRLIEFVDVLLRRGSAGSFGHVTRKLRDLARKNQLGQLDVAPAHGVEDSVAKALLLGSRDIVLDVLIDDLTPEQRELLWQASVATAPFTSEDLLTARYGTDTAVEHPRLAAEDVDRLVDLTLLSSTPVSSALDHELVVHPWISGALLARQADAKLTERHRRAADMRLHRVNHGRGRFDDLVEVVRHLAGCHDYDGAVQAAFDACDILTGEVAISALLAEAVPLLPHNHPSFLALADRECEALLRIGLLTATTERRAHMLTVSEDRAAADPGNAGYHRDLSVSPERLGDLAVAGGDSATAERHYRTGLGIAERLAAADPGNAGYQRDLSISHNKLGNL
ncbi:MAG: hypothetical protein ACRDQ5_16510 [Sciscionella sp.]